MEQPDRTPCLGCPWKFPSGLGKTPGHAEQSQASVTHPAAVRGVKQREMQDWNAGHPGSLPDFTSALAAGEELEPCWPPASVYPLLRGGTPYGVFAPRRICREFFPNEGSKALKYSLSSVQIHPPEQGGYALAVCCPSVPSKWHCLGAWH